MGATRVLNYTELMDRKSKSLLVSNLPNGLVLEIIDFIDDSDITMEWLAVSPLFLEICLRRLYREVEINLTEQPESGILWYVHNAVGWGWQCSPLIVIHLSQPL